MIYPYYFLNKIIIGIVTGLAIILYLIDILFCSLRRCYLFYSNYFYWQANDMKVHDCN